jgi:hypothetical protein
MRDQTAVFEDSEDFHGERGKVIFVTFVGHDPVFEVDRDSVPFFNSINPYRASFRTTTILYINNPHSLNKRRNSARVNPA